MGIMKFFKILILFFLFSFLSYSQENSKDIDKGYITEIIKHKVKRKQTLYTISKLYNVSIDDIKKYNTQIQGLNISRKMELNIPIKRKLVLKNDIFQINKDSIKSEIKEGKDFKINLLDSRLKNKNIKLGLLAPFNLNNIEIDSVENSKNYLKNLNLSTISLDFYSGLLTALEKGQELGLNLDLKVIDTQNDFLNIAKIISTNSFENYDFIIGPLIPRNINQFSIGIIKSNTPVISPLTSKEIEINNNVFQSMPSEESQRDKMFKYIEQIIETNPDPCVMIIYDDKSQKIKEKLLKSYPYAELINTDLTNGLVDPELTDSLLVNNKNNIVFLESQNLNVITSVSSLLNSQISQERNIAMMTTYRADVYENENISYEHLGNLKFTYPSYHRPIYDEKFDVFNELYLNNYGKLPNKIAIRGYDLTLDLILRVAYKNKLIKSLGIGETDYMQNKFNYLSKNNGYINNSVFLIQHDKLNIFEIYNDK
ncbi:MAG TPA: LysM peptidoglycan-binding domain-containing protein [Flavobacteriaceae bacterium]|jgi:LysM repeat protein|nr:LysM peptidoglycan-binding domain-containing protein [Flavobacteriaceae bacterium]